MKLGVKRMLSDRPLCPTVSVLIPAYNAAAYLGEAIKSVLGQTYVNYEIIVIDDGSSDHTATIARQFPEVRCLTQKNQGVSAARNLGIKNSSGELIAFLDADDQWHPQKLESQVSLMCHYEKCSLCRTGISENPDCLLDPWSTSSFRHHCERDFATSFLNPFFGTSTVVVRRTAIETAGLFDHQLRIAEDVDFFLRVLLHNATVAVLDEKAVFKRPVPGSLGDDSAAGYVQLLEVYRRFLEANPLAAKGLGKYADRARQSLWLRYSKSLLAGGRRGAAIRATILGLQAHLDLEGVLTLCRCFLPMRIRRKSWFVRR